MFLIATAMASEGTEVIVDCGEGGEGGSLVCIVLGFAPDQVGDSYSFI
jgi:hypothetical protein